MENKTKVDQYIFSDIRNMEEAIHRLSEAMRSPAVSVVSCKVELQHTWHPKQPEGSIGCCSMLPEEEMLEICRKCRIKYIQVLLIFQDTLNAIILSPEQQQTVILG